jgi:hypothetical protein
VNTSALKSFAPAVRRQLMEAVTRKLDYVLTADTPDLRAAVEQVKSLRKEADRDRTALIERVAYTWFNRLAAIRFLDARGWHPFHARVLTPASAQETQPELLKLVRTGSLPEELRPHSDPDRLNDLLDGRLPTSIAGADPQGEVYRHLVLAVCRFYHAALPFLFERLNDETELLLPDDLLTATSVAEGFRTEISDADCADVEILGWLYQFYIAEKKDAVMARNAAVPKEDIPAVTQLFTPHWIVRYLVENSLGRLWLLNRPNSKLREHMHYYIEGEPETDFLKIAKPEDIKLLDPASGSAHMLTDAFDLLVKIYEEEGYPPSQIAELILTHNLHGLDICPRAAQLAQFALLCKAREVSRSAFRRAIAPKVICLEDVRFEENELRDYIRALGLGDLFNQPMLKLLHQFEDATNFGSLIQPCLDERAIAFARRAIEAKELGDQLFLHETHRKVLQVLAQAEALTQRYHVVVANPPYMGGGGMNGSLRRFAEDNFPDSKANLFAQFIERSFNLALRDGYSALVVMESWMFLASFARLRAKLLAERRIERLAHMANMVMGIAFGTCAAIFKNGTSSSTRGHFCYVAFNDLNDQNTPTTFPPENDRRVVADTGDFAHIAGCPIAYWLSPKLRACFAHDTFGDHMLSEGAVKTGNNERFIRFAWEVERKTIGPKANWRRHPKGGTFRRWYGNLECVVDWSDSARRHYREDFIARIPTDEIWDIEGVTWTAVSSGELSFRMEAADEIANNAALFIYPKKQERLIPYLCCLNSRLTKEFLKVISPTVNYLVGDVLSVPFPVDDQCFRKANHIGKELISISKADWDSFETSLDFRDQPLLRPGLKGATLEASWQKWERQSTTAISRMQELETENNRLFIAAYGLDGELQPEVPEEQITLARADGRKDAAALLSYAVGCMMGRYSLDQPGLILADAGATVEDYRAKVPNPTFAPDADGIVPVLDGEWFPDDVVARTREFLKTVWGAAHLDENVAWLEKALDKDLRKYFVRDFYKNHLSNERAYGYKKRPIYWLVSSPEGSFQALIYLHRYTKDTVNTVLNSYLREFIHKLEARAAHLAHVESTSTNAREKTAARKEADKLRKALKECQEWEREVVLPLAQQRIELDLDDGVKTNYLKFPGLLAKIPGFDKKEED